MLEHAGRIAPQRHWRMPLHAHGASDELIIVVAGEIHTQISGQTLVGAAGSVLHYPRGMPHEERAVGGVALETLFLSYVHPEGLDVPLVSRDRAGHVLHAARWILALESTREKRDHDVAETLLSAILHELASARQGPESDLVRRVQRFVEYHLAEPLTLDRLADEVGMSKFHFARTFGRAAGQSPMAYVRAARVKAAQTLLATSALPLRAIAPLVGLGDQTQLSRTFRRVTGMAPGGYRRAR